MNIKEKKLVVNEEFVHQLKNVLWTEGLFEVVDVIDQIELKPMEELSLELQSIAMKGVDNVKKRLDIKF